MTRYASLLFFLLLVSKAAAQPLDLRQAERLAIERNLNLRAQEDATRAAEAAVLREYGIYDLFLEGAIAEGVQRSRNRFLLRQDDPLSEVTSVNRNPLDEIKYRRWDFSLIRRIPTGAEIRLSFDNSREKSNTTAPIINPAYTSDLRLSLVQPLLRDFGREITEQNILFAIKDRQQEAENLREQAFGLVRNVRNAYFDVLRYRDNLSARQTSVEVARQVLRENRARVEAGVLPPVENLEAEVGLQLREREVLDSRRAYEDALDRLTLLLNDPDRVEVTDEVLGHPSIDISEESGFRTAMEHRPDVRRRVREIERLELASRIARNRLLPEVNLGASYGHTGLGGTYGDDLEDIASDDFRNWEVGLSFSYPLGNTEARNELLRTRLLLKGNKSLLAQLRDEIRKEIQAAIRDLEVNRKKIEVTELATRLARERLQTLIRRKEVGLATTRDVLEGEEDLAQARTDHIAALADYNVATTQYFWATGVLLDREGIRFDDTVNPRSDRPLVRMEER